MKKLIVITLLMVTIFVAKAQTPAKPEMIKVKGGTFTMGSMSGVAGTDEKPTHSVTVSSFRMSKYETTLAEYAAFCKATGHKLSDFSNDNWGTYDTRPVTIVSFDDANAYCKWLSEQTKKNYRLPTEAEWEFAARGGTKSKGYIYSGSDDLDEIAWTRNNRSRASPSLVGSKKPNELGLYDMSGNVLEWCSDWYSDSYYSNTSSTNPQGPVSGTDRVVRGGCWISDTTDSRVAKRNHVTPGFKRDVLGFRVVVSE
jgi:formylglycine-generating enzyme required for sulfatase activity